MARLRVFIDSDVVISALLSTTGASYLLLVDPPIMVDRFICDLSHQELARMVQRLKLSSHLLEARTSESLQIVTLTEPMDRYSDYVLDPDDRHIVAGAVQADCRFLVTYNQKHFRANLLQRDFDLLVVTPAMLLQYLRLKS